MPPLSPEDEAYILSQYCAGKTATQIQRKFKREKRKTFSLPTISTWLKRVPTQFETMCALKREVLAQKTYGSMTSEDDEVCHAPPASTRTSSRTAWGRV